jgi:hypothetical protein
MAGNSEHLRFRNVAVCGVGICHRYRENDVRLRKDLVMSTQTLATLRDRSELSLWIGTVCHGHLREAVKCMKAFS